VTRRLAILAVALGVPLLTADAALACSCLAEPDRDKLEAADAAFVGRLVEVREVHPPAEGEVTSSGDPVDYIYRVGRVYKDGPGINRGRRVRVRSARDAGACGLDDRIGRLVGLFAYRRHHRWHSNSCLTTTPRRLRRAAGGAHHAVSGVRSSITGICLGARLRYWTQPG
jgi:hypothetical protein